MNNPIELNNLDQWYLNECEHIQELFFAKILKEVGLNLNTYIHFPKTAILLWEGCIRCKSNEKHNFPIELKQKLRTKKIPVDSRGNEPAVNAYLYAERKRPNKLGNPKHGWSTHHLYNNKFPYPKQDSTIHAVKDSKHFNQNAGLVAVHPIADAIFEEFDIFAWYVRAQAYLKFGYDPDKVFNASSNDYGFENNSCFQILLEMQKVGKHLFK